MRYFILKSCVILVFFNTSVSSLTANLPEDARLNFIELANKYGHNCEEFEVTTSDGYILKLFHIKGEKNTVFLMHGIFDSSDTFLIRGNNSMGIALADSGYDVWFGNIRGNKYSRRHVKLDPDKNKKAFWDFNMQEFGVYDLPAMIDFILLQTKQKQLSVIAHSQGTAIFYILCSEKSEYNDKIKIIISLAPICYLHNTRPTASTIFSIWPTISPVLASLGVEELFSSSSEAVEFVRSVCSQPNVGYDLCAKGFMFPLLGEDPEEIGPDFFNVIIGHYPAGSSRKDLDHQAQIKQRKKFAKFDYGTLQNLVKYGTAQPPVYALRKITAPVALIAGKSDNLSDLEDVALLAKELPNVVYSKVMDREEFNHVDYIWGEHLGDYMLPILYNLLNKYA